MIIGKKNVKIVVPLKQFLFLSKLSTIYILTNSTIIYIYSIHIHMHIDTYMHMYICIHIHTNIHKYRKKTGRHKKQLLENFRHTID